MENEIELLKAKLETRKELCDNLQQRIDKAIEYIKKLQKFKIKYVLMFEEKELYATENDFVKELLAILGDKEKER